MFPYHAEKRRKVFFALSHYFFILPVAYARVYGKWKKGFCVFCTQGMEYAAEKVETERMFSIKCFWIQNERIRARFSKILMF